MTRRCKLLLLGTPALFACTDSTAPTSVPAGKPLSLQEYALQLRGDPLIKTVSQMLERPLLAGDIDNALNAFVQPLPYAGVTTNLLVASARADLGTLSSDQIEEKVTEADVLAAVITVTLDRLSEVSADSGSASHSSDPPPQ